MKEYIWGESELDKLVEEFTTKSDVGIEKGSDYHLLPYAIEFEKAYLEFMYRHGKISDDEYRDATKRLDEIPKDSVDLSNYEDIHSYIEERVKEVLGRSIYICRSRNDVITAIERLYLKDALKTITREIYGLFESLLNVIKKVKRIPAPVHTHYVLADAVSLDTYFISYLEEIERIIGFIPAIHKILTASPLGSGAIGGCPINIDFTWLNRRLGFENRHTTSIDGVNSRKTHILYALMLYSLLTGLLARISRDMIRLSTQYRVVELPREFTTGSSQLIHKINPDVLELIIGLHNHVSSTLAISFQHFAEESGYQRFLQLDKYYVIKYTRDVIAALRILSSLIMNIEIHDQFRCGEELKMTWLATELSWRYNIDYRELYMLIKETLQKGGTKYSIIKIISERYSLGLDELSKLAEKIFEKKYNNSILSNPEDLMAHLEIKIKELFKDLMFTD